MKTLKQSTTNNLPLIISIFLALLFVYAAVSKILEFQNFQAQLGQSPLISAYTGFISYAVLTTELLISLLLLIPQTRYLALFAAAFLMIMFTAYIIAILNFSANIPCSCGGILESMGWKEHLVFNIIVTVLTCLAIILISTDWKDAVLRLGIIVIIGSASMTALYLSSEHLMHKENPFVRRFVSGSAIKVNTVRMPYNSTYFAGVSQNAIYIGDVMAPLYITTYDTLLKVKRTDKIQLDQINFSFHALQVQVLPPYFYVLDGTVPIIYKGRIGDWKAKAVLKEEGYFFTRATVIDANSIAFRTQLEKSGENALGVFNITDRIKTELKTDLLQKQIDGFFDTDGMMKFDTQSKTFVYLYYYRNQYTVTDELLRLKYRGNTIDTTKRANLKVAYIRNSGQKKLASPGFVTNRSCALRNNLLFVDSALRGRYEPIEMWDISSIVDIYDTAQNEYVSSIYIYDYNESKIKDMIAHGNNLYVINGLGLQRYKLGQLLKEH